MADAEDNIPTLTDIAHPGDTEMLNHFDAHQFDIDTGEIEEAEIEFDVALNADANVSDKNITDENITDEVLTGEFFESENLTSPNITDDITDNINSSPELEQLLNEIPSIQIKDDAHAELDNEDFSAAMQAVTVTTHTSESVIESANENDSLENHDTELKEKIDQAIREALPGIEAQLKGKLYSKFGI